MSQTFGFEIQSPKFAMVTLMTSGMHGEDSKTFPDLETAREWIYSENWSLAEDVVVFDELENKVFETDGTEIRWHQVENKLGPYAD